jgi:GNAT superfamily N-acetyltransferase
LSISYQEEKIADALEEMKPMLLKHWEELANYKDVRPLDVHYERYIQLNELGFMRMFTVRDGDKLVGYATFYLSHNLHYKNWFHAINDVYYLDPDYRLTGIGIKFFEEIEEWLKSLGIRSAVVMDKINHSHEKFFKRMGYQPIEQNYEKVF